MKCAIDLTRSDAEEVLNGRHGELEALRDQRLFITGGTGILGAWLLELIKVLNDDHGFNIHVHVFSRHAAAFAKRWPHLGQQRNVSFVEGDIRCFNEFPADTRFVIHAAALTDRRLLASQPSAVAEVNGIGTLRVLRAANLLEDLQKMVLLSSCLVYGRQPWELLSVDEGFSGALPCNDVGAVYAESKRFAEIAAQSAVSESKLPVVTLRPFALVGPYQSLELPWAVTDFIRDSFRGGPIRIMGDGTTVRSIMYASDFAFWVLSALVNGKPRETYNVGSPHAIDLGSLAHMITQLFSPTVEIRLGVGQATHTKNRLVPNVQHIQKDLGVTITVPLAQALQRTVTWHRLMLPK